MEVLAVLWVMMGIGGLQLNIQLPHGIVSCSATTAL